MKRSPAVETEYAAEQYSEFAFSRERSAPPPGSGYHRFIVNQLEAALLVPLTEGELGGESVASVPVRWLFARLELMGHLDTNEIGEIRNVLLRILPHSVDQVVLLNFGRRLIALEMRALAEAQRGTHYRTTSENVRCGERPWNGGRLN